MASIKRPHRTYNCSFCDKNQDDVQRLIAGPGGIYICDECIDKIHERPESGGTRVNTEAPEASTVRCSFCGKKAKQVTYLVQEPQGVSICNECIHLCREIIEEEHPHR